MPPASTAPHSLGGGLRARLASVPASAWVVACLATGAYLLLATLQWRSFESPSWDLGIFTQVLQQYARLEAPIVHLKGADYNILGDHFHPILVLLTPIFAPWPTAYTLLVVQSALLGVSAFFVAMAADHLLGHAGGWLVGIAYGFSWGVQQAAAVQFHEVAVGAPILALGLWAIVRERWVAAAVSLGLLVFVKEDLGLTVTVLGVLLAWRSRRWLLGGGLAVWGLAWFFVTLRVILPAMNPRGQYDYGQHLDLGAALANPFVTIAEMIGNEQKMLTLFMLLVSTALLVLRSNLAFALLPTLAWRFLSSVEGHWGPTWHYSLMLMPIAFVAAAEGAAALRESPRPVLAAWGRHGAALVLMYAVAVAPTMPLWQLSKGSRWHVDGVRPQAAAELVSLVRPGSVVEADISLMNQLVDRADVYFLGNQGNPVPDYLVIDNRAGGWSSHVDAVQYATGRHEGTRWRPVFDQGDYQLAERVG